MPRSASQEMPRAGPSPGVCDEGGLHRKRGSSSANPSLPGARGSRDTTDSQTGLRRRFAAYDGNAVDGVRAARGGSAAEEIPVHHRRATTDDAEAMAEVEKLIASL